MEYLAVELVVGRSGRECGVERGGVAPASVLLLAVVVLPLRGPWSLFGLQEVHSVDLQLHWVFALSPAVVGEDVVEVVFDGGLR